MQQTKPMLTLAYMVLAILTSFSFLGFSAIDSDLSASPGDDPGPFVPYLNIISNPSSSNEIPIDSERQDEPIPELPSLGEPVLSESAIQYIEAVLGPKRIQQLNNQTLPDDPDVYSPKPQSPPTKVVAYPLL